MSIRSSRLSTLASSAEASMSDAARHAATDAEKLVRNFREEIQSGSSTIGWDVGTVEALVDVLKHPNGIDDRKYLLEHLLIFLSKHSTTAIGAKLSDSVVELLYDDLPHPPETYIGPEYAFRSADGSGNNLQDPELGKANRPYARSAQPAHPLPRNEMPDAGLVFDTLLRREEFVKHPAGLSSLMFSFAALVIHSIFRTSHGNPNINETSSYVDLAPLYGNDQKMQDQIRIRDGRGLLHPDTFAEDRLLLLPPAVSVLLVLFNRNHNYIAKMLLQLNERGEWTDPDQIPKDDPQRTIKLLKQEEELFQIARLINCGWFATVVFSDYFCAILGLVRDGSSWSLNPFEDIRNQDHSLFERGRGNVCSVEFNCLYRWHATTSQPDEEWVDKLSQQIFPGQTYDSLTIEDFRKKARELAKKETSPTQWTFGQLKRQPDGTFKDEELAGILQQHTANPAGAFKARGTPHVMRLHEIMGIESARQWGCCSLNDFRQFLGLKRYSSFEEWNPNKEVAAAAQKLYGDIERLELYVGLQAEATKPVMEGAGLCPSYTISRAILSDAIALTRGDRYFTADYTPVNLTCWGFADCQRNSDAPGCGSTLGRLFLRNLPQQFSPDSTFTWFPLMTPEAMDKVLTKLGERSDYDLGKPTVIPRTPEVSSYRDVAQALHSDRFSVRYADRAAKVISGQGFFIASDNPSRAAREQRAIVGVLGGYEAQILAFFYDKTKTLMERESYQLVGVKTRCLDIVRDVLKYIPLQWASNFAGIKLKDHPKAEGDYTPQELFDILADIYSFLFLDVPAEKLLRLQQKVKGDIDTLLKKIKHYIRGAQRSSISLVFDTITSMFVGKDRSPREEILEKLWGLGYSPDELAHSVLAVLIACSVELSQAVVNVVNFYIDDNKPRDVQDLVAKGTLDKHDGRLLSGYILEALRLDPPFSGAYQQALQATALGHESLTPKETVLLNVAGANLDAQAFPEPQAVNPTRPSDRYLASDGPARCLGTEFSTKIIASVVRAVFSYKTIRRAPGQSGQLKRFKADMYKTSTYVYLSPAQELVPWATSMVVQWD
ncbi:linoleate diol synthase [Rhodofomes roseus]|uniref:Linoleate diol synthase n=1 Tax=Rhodofomes roseus TaxID=34475 RepID=A0ABQ8KMZ5_9APHY|nr:linoleate diol synthase [Rhodofomes roseus]KAH9839793.1 linoleate diol synthase [Rhodofomes roseus]